MKNLASAIIRLAAASCLIGIISGANAAPVSSEDRYIAARDAAIAKISKLYDEKKDDEATKAEAAATSDLFAQMKVIVANPAPKGFGPAKLNLDAYSSGDQGFGLLDGLRFDALVGQNGAKAGENGSDGKYVEPKAHVIITTQTLLERWLRAHKDWWGGKIKNVPQQTGAALKDDAFYTQAVSTDAAVVHFNELPIAKPASATSAFAMLGGRTQDTAPNEADEVFVAALANGKAYVAYGSIKPKVEVPGCIAVRAGYIKKAEQLASNKQEAMRQQGEDAFKRCFAQGAPRQPSFVEATRQAEALLAAALGK
jgi:hypothetical protein